MGSNIIRVNDTRNCLIHWLGFSKICSYSELDNVVEQYLGTCYMDVEPYDGFKKSYKKCYTANDVSVCLDHHKGFVYVLATGNGCSHLSSRFSLQTEDDWRSYIESVLNDKWTFRRMDAACDDKDGLLDLDEIEAKLRAEDYLGCKHVSYPLETVRGDVVNRGFIIGSPSSKQQIRIYDKALEQGLFDQHWIRVELQAKKDYAHQLAIAFVEGGFSRILSHMKNTLSFRERIDTDTNESRWPVSPWWDDFLDVEPQRIVMSVDKEKKDYTGKVKYLLGASAWLATFNKLYGLDWLLNLIKYGEQRMKPEHHEIIEDFYISPGEFQNQFYLPTSDSQISTSVPMRPMTVQRANNFRSFSGQKALEQIKKIQKISA